MSPHLNGVAVSTSACPAVGYVNDACGAVTTTGWVAVLVLWLLSVTVSDTV